MAVKVLVIGSLSSLSNLISLLPKLTTLHSKNQFSICILLGDLFSISDSDSDLHSLIAGKIHIPLPIYFSLGRLPLPKIIVEKIRTSSGEVCQNLFFLGKRAVLNSSEGVRIVVLGGKLDPNLITSNNDGDESLVNNQIVNEEPFYSENECRSLKGADRADILISYEWPEGVANGSKVEISEEGPVTDIAKTRCLGALAKWLRPRYHFVSGPGVFWEREPYRNELRRKEDKNSMTPAATRFIALANYGNEGKKKWMYAFNLDVKEFTQQLPQGTTDCPYSEEEKNTRGTKRDHQSDEEAAATSDSTFFWGDYASSAHERSSPYRREGRGGSRKRARNSKFQPRHLPGPESCFFCLSNPSLEKHLIVSIGNDSYLTTAKGPLTNATINPETLSFPSHMLIIPFQHCPTNTAIEDLEIRKNTLKEMTRYRLAIERMLNERGCGAVTFEIARRNGVHFHWQVVPVTREKLDQVEEIFTKEAENDKLGTFEKREINVDDGNETDSIAQEGGKGEEDHFRLWISGQLTSLALRLKEGDYFDLQFGRRVLGKLLGAHKIHWKDCIQSQEEEVKDARAFKEAFKAFDFSL